MPKQLLWHTGVKRRNFKDIFFCNAVFLKIRRFFKIRKSKTIKMRDLASIDSYYERLLNEFSHLNQENSPCNGIENVSIFVNKKRRKNRKKHNVFEHAQQPTIAFRLSRFSKYKKQGSITKPASMPELNKCTRPVPPRNKSGHRKDTKPNKYKQSPFQSKFIANVVSEHRFDNCFMNLFNYPSQTKWKIYRCQLGAIEDSCCCSCNSDAMFEVMKSLYDCYKAQNCDNCCCVLCSHKLQAERKLGEFRKSMTSIARDKVLDGKTAAEKEKILNEMVKSRIPLPTGKTASEKALIDKTRKELGLPPSPKNAAEKAKMRKAEVAGIITPLEGKTPSQKEEILRAQANFGLPLPEGRTASEKALIDKIKAKKGPRSVGKSEFKEKGPILGARMRKAKADGFMTPLIDKTPADRETILRELANRGIPLPEGQSPSENNIIDKIRTELGLPIEPAIKAIRDKHDEAAIQGILLPLEGKTPTEKESILQGQHNMGIPLPIGRTPSEKALIARIMASPRPPSLKTAGLLTSITGKSPDQKDKILRGRAMKGLTLPEGKSASEKKLIDKVRADLGLPKEPKTKSIRDKHEQAAKAGLLQPLEGKTPAEKEKILKGLHDLGIPLPEGRTPSEKALVAKIAAKSRHPSRVAPPDLAPSERLRRAKAEGLLTPLKGKTPEQREKILKGLAMTGLPLPEGQSLSEKKLINKVRADLGLPMEPKTKSIRDKHEQAAKAGLLQALEGKTPAEKENILKGLHDLEIPLPEGRSPSEKALIAKVAASSRHPSRVVPPVLAPSEQMRRAKAEGLLTPLTGKTPEQREHILKALAKRGIPLPEGQTPSEKKLVDKVRADLGLPTEPKTKSIRDKHEQAAKAGLLQPLEGKTAAEKGETLKGLHDLGIPLPEGRTPSEKALIAKVAAGSRHPSKVIPPVLAPSEQMRRAKAEGLLTPLTSKTPEQREHILKALAKRGIPLPEGQTPSEKKLVDKVRADLGLPTEPKTKSIRDKHEQAAKAGLLQPLEGKTPAEQEKILQGLHELGIPLPKGRTPSEKALIAKVRAGPRALSAVMAPSEQMRRAKAEGLLTPLKGKTPEQKENILRALANGGIPLPEGQTPSEKKLVDKVRTDLGLPKEPKTRSIRDKHEQAAKAGLLQPLEGKTPAEKEKTLKGLHDLGIPLPEGRTPSEKALIDKVAASSRHPSRVIPPVLAPSEQMRRAKADGLLTPLTGKTPEQKEKILRALVNRGIPLPEAQSSSEKKLVDMVRAELGLPTEPKTKSLRDKHEQAAKAGLLQPLKGKTPAEKEKTLKGLHDLGIPLPEGRTPSEKALIAKVAASSRHPSRVIPPVLAPSEQMRRAKAEGLLTPLKGKTPEQKENILRALANRGIPLPEAQSSSEKKLVDKVRAELGLPKEPKTRSIRGKHEQAAKAGLLQPLEGKTPAEKEKTLKGLHDLGIPLPEGRTPSEKALIAKVAASSRHPSRVIPPVLAPSEQMRRAKAEGLLTPLKGKTPEQKEKILRALANRGIPVPEAQSPSEKKLVDKVRADLGLPKEPKTRSIRGKHEEAAKAGLLLPLEGKTPAEKEKTLKGLHDFGIPLPEGRTPSEKALIAKVAASSRHPSRVISPVLAPSEQMRRAKAEGLFTPLKGKTPVQKEKILKALANRGIPLPEAQSPSEKKLVDKVRADLGLPKEPKTRSIRGKHEQAAKAGLLQPLEGKTPAEKEKTLKGLHDLGIPLPEGRTPSEKALIAKVAASSRHPSRVIPPVLAPSEQMRRAKAEGLLTPLKGKTPEQKGKILRALANRGIPLPEAQSSSEKKLVDKVRAELGLPTEPKTKSIRDKHEQAAKAGLLQPLKGKTPAEKEKTLKGLHDLGIPLPEGRTPSEKALIDKVAASSRHPSRVIPPVLAPSEQMRRAKAEGLLTPLKGKTPEQKEKILRALANRGIPLPEAQSSSEKKLVDKVRAELGLPTEPKTKSIRDKHEQAAKAGLLQPLEGKTTAEKEKTLKGLHDLGIPLPEGRTPSEKALIAKVKASPRAPPIKTESLPTVTSDKIRKAKAAGLFTPLAGKPPEQKDKILQGLAEIGLPLPKGKTLSEKAIIDKIKKESGIPDRTPSEKLRKAKATGLLTPLKGKSPDQKEKILRGRVAAGLPLPMYKTPSEKALIQKIKDDTGYVTPSPSERLRRAKAAGLVTPLKGKTPSMKEKILRGMKAAGVPIPEGETSSEKKLISRLISMPLSVTQSEKQRAAKAAGLLTPLEGKTPAQKEKIVEGLAKVGLPLPEGKTKSEKSMIARVKARTPPEGKTLSEKSIIRKAKAAGLFTPITGKAPAEKERILKGLAEAGLPLPVGRTASEKDLVKKIRAEAGLPIEPTPSEKKGKIRKKEKKVGVSASKRAAGIDAEEFQDIIKTTTCDRGCGCDKKKIKFKHSYVKIRVTSPDISSFCDCPGECIPGVKSGAFIDNEGIKVTIGSAVGIPSYSMECINQVMLDEIVSNTDLSKTRTNYHNDLDDSKKPKYKVISELVLNNTNKTNYILNASSSDMSLSTRSYRIQSENIHGPSRLAQYLGRTSKSGRIVESLRGLQSLDDFYKEPISKPNSASSYETILLIKNDMSLSTSTTNSMDSISLISVIDGSLSSSSAHYSGYESTCDSLSINSLDGPTTSDDAIDHPIAGERDVIRNIGAPSPQQYTILRMSQLEANFGNKKLRKRKASSETEDPIVLFNRLPIKIDVSKIMFKIMSKKRFATASSIFIVVPMSDDDEQQGSSNCVDSITSILSSVCHFTASTTRPVDLGNNSSWFRLPGMCKTSTESSACNTLPCFGPRFNTVLPNRPCQHVRSQQNQITKSPWLCSCPPDDFIEGRNRSAKVQKPSIASVRCEGDTAPKKAGVSWFRSRKTASSELVCDIPPCSACVPADHRRPHGRQHQTTVSTTPCVRPPDDCEDTNNPSAKRAGAKKAGKSLSWFRGSSASDRENSTEVPCFDPSFSPEPPCHPCQHGCSQQNQKSKSPSLCSCPPDDFEKERNRSAKVQKPSLQSMRSEGDTAPKKAGWFRSRKAASSELVCDIPPCSACVPGDHRRPHGFQHQTTVSTSPCFRSPDDCEDTSNPSAKRAGAKKAGKSWFRRSSASDAPPCFDPSPNPCRHGQSQQNQMTNSSWLCVCPPDDFGETTNRSAKVQKPSLQSMPYESDTAPKKVGWIRSRKTSSELVCDIPPCSYCSSSPVPSDHCHPHGRSQQCQTTVSTSTCVCPPDDSEETINPATKKAKKGKSWFRRSSASDAPPRFDPSFSPGPCQHGQSQQNQMKNSPSLCSCPPADFEETTNRSAKVQKPSISSMPYDSAPKKTGWFRSRKTASTELLCDIPPCSDCSSSPVPSVHCHPHGQQCQTAVSTSTCVCPPDDSEETSSPSAKRAGAKKTGKSWFRRSSASDTPPCFDPSFSPEPRCHPCQHGLSQQHQKTKSSSLCSCPPDDFEETTNRSAKVQKPSISSMPYDSAPKKAGKSFSWSRLRKRKASVACDTPPCFDPSFSPEPPYDPCQHGRSQQNQITNSPSLCGCPPEDFKETTNLYNTPCICPPDEDTAPKKTGKSFSWFRLCKRKASVACDTPPFCGPMSSPVPSNCGRQRSRNQQNQTLESSSSCVCPPDELQESPSIESMRVAAKKAGISFSWSRLQRKKKARYSPQCFEPNFSPVPSNRPRQRGCSQQNQTPASSCSCVCPPDEETRNPSPKVRKPSSIESLLAAAKKAGSCWLRLASFRKGSDSPQCFDRSLSPVPPYDPGHQGCSQETQTPASVCDCPSGDLMDTRNPSATVQKPSLDSICHEVRTAPKKAGVGSGWFRLPYIRKTPAKDPEISKDSRFDFESPKDLTCACDEDKPMHPTDLESPESSKIICTCDEEKPKLALDFVCPCQEHDPIQEPEPAKKMVRLSDPIIQQPAKLAEGMTSVPQTLASSKTCKEDKPMSPKDPKSPNTSILKEDNILCGCKEDKPIIGQSKLLTSIKKSISKINETLKRGKSECVCNQDKPMSSKDTKSLKTNEQREAKITCGCKEAKTMSPKDPSSPKALKSSETGKKKEGESECMCNQDKRMSAKDPKSLKTNEQREEKITCGCKEAKTMSPKDLSSPKDLKSPETGKKKEGESECACNQDKPMSAKDPKSLKTNEQREEKVTCGCKEAKTMSPKDLSSLKDLKSPETAKKKEGKSECACNQDKPMSAKDPKSLKTNEQREEKVTCGCKEPKTMSPKEPSSPKDLKSPETGKKKERESECVCDQDKPMSAKDPRSLKTSKIKKGKVTCECKEETQPIIRQKRCPPQLPPVILGLPPVETPEGYLYEGIGPSCKWLDTGEIKRLRSELTQSTSGFKACKRRKLENSEVRVGKFTIEPPEDIELDFGEAIRYFATMNPQCFRQLMKEELENQRDAKKNKVKNDKKVIEKHKRKMEKARKKAKKEKESKKGIIHKTTTTNEGNTPISYKTTEFSDEAESNFPQGFKFSIVVKDGPTGLAGVECKDTSREFFMVRRHK